MLLRRSSDWLEREAEACVALAGTVLVQQLMSVLIGRHDVLFPKGEESPTALELCNNNNEVHRKPTAGQLQNRENNNPAAGVRQCSWETPESPNRAPLDNGSPGGQRPVSPRNSLAGRLDLARSPPLTVKKNPAFSKGSGIVTNGSFSSSSADGQEKSQSLPGQGTQARRATSLKAPGTKMGTAGVPNGGVRMGVSSTDVVNGTLSGRNGLWLPNGYVTLRDGKPRDCPGEPASQQNRLSTYDNVQLQQHLPPSSACEDKQSVDSATWSTSSCEISLPDNSTSCRSSTTTCPEQDFFGGHYEDTVLDAPAHEDPGPPQGEPDRRNGGGRGSRAASSSDNSEAFAANSGAGGHSALHSLVASLKQEMHKQKTEYEARIKR